MTCGWKFPLFQQYCIILKIYSLLLYKSSYRWNYEFKERELRTKKLLWFNLDFVVLNFYFARMKCIHQSLQFYAVYNNSWQTVALLIRTRLISPQTHLFSYIRKLSIYFLWQMLMWITSLKTLSSVHKFYLILLTSKFKFQIFLVAFIQILMSLKARRIFF